MQTNDVLFLYKQRRPYWGRMSCLSLKQCTLFSLRSIVHSLCYKVRSHDVALHTCCVQSVLPETQEMIGIVCLHKCAPLYTMEFPCWGGLGLLVMLRVL